MARFSKINGVSLQGGMKINGVTLTGAHKINGVSPYMLPSGYVSHYTFDNTMADAEGNNVNFSPTISFGSGVYNQALKIPQGDSSWTQTAGYSYDNMSLVVLFKSTNMGASSITPLVSLMANNPSVGTFFNDISAQSSSLWKIVSGAGAGHEQNINPNISSNQWSVLGLVYNMNDYFRVYINGVRRCSLPPRLNNCPIVRTWLYNIPVGDTYWDELYMWNSALTDQQMKDAYYQFKGDL